MIIHGSKNQQMIRLNLLLHLLLPVFLYPQDCDCTSNFAWLKKTFEENDAGFQYALEKKGAELYGAHNKRIAEKVTAAETLQDCQALLNEWLAFFRPGHIGIGLENPVTGEGGDSSPDPTFPDWETYDIVQEDFKAYLDQKEDPGMEGIWDTSSYVIGIKKDGDS